MNEICCVLTGQQRGGIWYGRLQQRREGEPASVELAWAWALEREEGRADVLGFYHTHPAGWPAPSPRDVRTMRAWVSCLGKPLLCVIESGDDLAAYLFRSDEDDGRRLARVQRFPGRVVIGCEE